MNIEELIKLFKSLARKSEKITKSFFESETIKNDLFIGISVLEIKKFIKTNSFSLSFYETCIKSIYHEIRLFAIFGFEIEYNKHLKKNNLKECKKIFDIIERNFDKIDNWDLVDTIAYKTFAIHLWTFFENDLSKIFEYLKNMYLKGDCWQKRMTIVSNIFFIKKINEINMTLKLLDIFIKNKEDNYYLQKAFGWVLKEFGKINKDGLIKILEKYKQNLPKLLYRTASEKIKN